MSNELNFSGGPGALPAEVLAQASEAIRAVPETGISLLGMSHRTPWFRAVVAEAEDNIRTLLGIPSNYHVLFMQGGGSLQFAMLPMSFLRGKQQPADYVVSGYWSAKAPPEAHAEGQVRIAWDGAPTGYSRIPQQSELQLSSNAAYLHYVSNETVEGLSFDYVPDTHGVPLVCDMSSDLLTAPLDVSRYAMIYAHAQKNLGPSGVTVVILQDGFLQTAAAELPSILDYRVHLAAGSIYNTPPVFAIYVLMLVTRWMRHTIGGLGQMAELNRIKARLVHSALAARSDIYQVHGEPNSRSKTNIAFRLANPAHELAFLQAAERRGITGLEGHRSLGGMRASLYNAVSVEAAGQLATFIREWADTPR
jgi:phosphoserine aminotransferase